jgi:SAM-dependent methyltransferase
MIKKYFPNTQVYGIDLDDNHITYAKITAKELGVDVNYEVADIKNLPFEDNTFDLVFSHTVGEHLPFDAFIKEQKRILKPNGIIKILLVNPMKKNDNQFTYLLDDIYEIFDKLQQETEDVGKFGAPPQEFLANLSKYGFINLNVEFPRITYYFPDLRDFERAKMELDHDFYTLRADAEFMLSKSTNRYEYELELLNLINARYLRRLDLLNNGEKIFDFQSTNLIVYSGTLAN